MYKCYSRDHFMSTLNEVDFDNLNDALNHLMMSIYSNCGNGDMDNGGKGSLWNCAKDIYASLKSGNHYFYADTEWWIEGYNPKITTYIIARQVKKNSIEFPSGGFEVVRDIQTRISYKEGSEEIIPRTIVGKMKYIRKNPDKVITFDTKEEAQHFLDVHKSILDFEHDYSSEFYPISNYKVVEIEIIKEDE